MPFLAKLLKGVMMRKKEYSLPYGKKEVRFGIDEGNVMGTLLPKKISPPENETVTIEKALNNPIESPLLPEIVARNSKVVLITSDITRSTPSSKMLPPLLEQLEMAGVKRKNMGIVFALGLHRKHTPLEQKSLLGEIIYQHYKCVDHDKEKTLDMGETKSGIPIQIFREVAEANVKICIGNIEPHYFAGYTGGAKSIMPGVSSQESLTYTHKMMLLPGSVAGKLKGNPTREAIEEVGEKIGIDFILNVVLNPQKKIVAAVAGNRIAAHRTGCRLADECFKVPITEKADVVIVSPGGYPKDINVYQAQKALDNAKYAVKEGGTIILVAECPEGLGDTIFEDWMMEATAFRDPVERLQREFVIGGHKAAAIGMLLEKAKVILVSSLPPNKVKQLFFAPAQSVNQAIAMTFQEHGKNASFLIIPSGGLTLPYLTRGELFVQ